MCVCKYKNLFDNIKTRIGNQRLGDADAVGGLVVLQQRRHDARKGQRRAVQSMCQLDFLLLVAVAELEAVGLERLEIRYRRNFEPAFLGFGVDFEIVGQRRGERHVAAAQAQVLGTLLGSFGGTQLVKYRIEQLEKKVEKHNSIVERTYILEEKVKVANHRIEDLERKGEE